MSLLHADRRLLVVLAIACAIRVACALTVAPGLSFLDDDFYYHGVAQALADGHGYVRPVELVLHGQELPTAEHPPLYPLLLAAVAWLGGDGVDVQRLVNVLVGTGTVLVVALIARRLAGERAALAAAVLAAVHPAFVAADASLMSEPLLGLLTAAVVLQALRARAEPGVAACALLGALIALAALTRTESLLLAPVLAVAVARAAPGRRLALGATTLLATAVVLAPWVARNASTFGRPLVSTNDGTTLAGSNCRQTYYGAAVGGFTFACAQERRPTRDDEAERFARLRARGLQYADAHRGRAVVVAGARVLGLWGVWAPRRQFVVTGRDVRMQQLGVGVFYVVAALGGVTLWRRRREADIAILLAPILVATIAAALTYGGPRLRYGAEVVLVALVGVTLASRHRRSGTGARA